MKLFVVGATGRTGRVLLSQAIGRGHQVTALVRCASALEPIANMTVVVGNPRNVDELAAALPGHDIVISALGHRSKADGTLLRDSAAATLAALRRSGVRRYLVVSQGLLFPSRNPVIGLLRWFLADTVADSIEMERVVRASDVEWTIVRAPRLKEGGRSRGYSIHIGGRPGGTWSMERVDLAIYLLDEAEKATHPQSIVGVG